MTDGSSTMQPDPLRSDPLPPTELVATEQVATEQVATGPDEPTEPSQPTVNSEPTVHSQPTELAYFPAAPVAATYPAPPPSAVKRNAALLVPLAIGAAVSLTLGVYGQVHEGTGIAVNVAGFSSPLTVKVWLTTGAAMLAVVQLFTALVMWGKLPAIPAGKPISVLHRWSGRVAFLLTVPVAVHCLYALGFQSYDTRVLLHSLLGCLFFGAFTTKMLILPKRNLPGWTLPVVGGVVFTVLVSLWLTSSLWYFNNNGVTF
jgi:hypothetical protein